MIAPKKNFSFALLHEAVDVNHQYKSIHYILFVFFYIPQVDARKYLLVIFCCVKYDVDRFFKEHTRTLAMVWHIDDVFLEDAQ